MLDFNFKSFVIVPLTATLAMTLMGCGGGGGGKDSVSKTLSSMNIESSSSVASVVSSSSSVQSTIASESSSSVSSSSSSESVVFSSTDSSAQSSTQSSVAPESSSSIASSSSSTSLLMGGAIQGTPLNLKADVTTFVGASAALDEPFGVTTDGTNLFFNGFAYNELSTMATVRKTSKCPSSSSLSFSPIFQTLLNFIY
ncbi:MAG: hypothetical protein EOP04_33040 [Proteobacteria bacterium]|nr:MAG: hypothetical protein EOP04_33040 [Pseudomonadota bacterium]